MRRPRYYLVTWTHGWNSGEWIVEGRLMAQGVVRRIKELDPEAEAVDMTQVTVHESVSSWERDAWPLKREVTA